MGEPDLLYVCCWDDPKIAGISMLQMIMLEGAKATTETVDALRTGASAMKAMQKATYVAFSGSTWCWSFDFFLNCYQFVYAFLGNLCQS